jgi:hypothetical protein
VVDVTVVVVDGFAVIVLFVMRYISLKAFLTFQGSIFCETEGFNFIGFQATV